jgi:HTH-type transcriptional repressor of NAD biosynthesis genes
MHAFVFGKFLPFHKGHQALIEFAAAQCDELTVLICCSDQEQLPAALRLEWMQETFKDNPRIYLQILEYKESELPNSSESSRSISQLWSNKFKAILPKVDLLVSSEPYGEYVAEYMGIAHHPFDPPRLQVPISATRIRSNPHQYWDYLPDAVKPYYQQKIVILGTESTGKSTLAAILAKKLEASLVTEAGRELIPDSTDFSIADLYRVAAAHTQLTEQAIGELKPLLILDTDIHITQSYAHFSFGQYLDLPEVYYEKQKGDIYLYLNADAPYVQDGSRMPEAERNVLDASHRATLAHFEVSFIEIVGNSWAERVASAWTAIKNQFAIEAR